MDNNRRLRLTEGEEHVVAHKAKMTPEVLLHCRSVRAQTAEKAFADSKTEGAWIDLVANLSREPEL